MKKRAPFLPFPSHSIGNPQIRSRELYSFSAIFRLEKAGRCEIIIDLNPVELRRGRSAAMIPQGLANEGSAVEVAGVDGECR